MDIQLDQRNHELSFHSKLDPCPFSERGTSDQLGSTEERTLSQSSALDENGPDIPLVQPRRLPPIQSVAPQYVPQRALSPHSTLPSSLSTQPNPHLSNSIQFLLNNTSEDKAVPSGYQHDGKKTESLQTAPIAITPSLPSTSLRRNSLGDGPLPSISQAYPHPLSPSPTAGSPRSYEPGTTGLSRVSIDTRQPPFLLPQDRASGSVGSGPPPSETTMAPSIPSAAHSPPPPPCYASPTLVFSIPSKPMTMENQEGMIPVAVDTERGSKAADEKRKRNATASHRFRRRRKEKEQEASSQISELKAHIRDLAEDKDFYQHRCQVLAGVIQQNHIFMAPQPPSPRRRRQASLGARLFQDNGASAPKQAKKRRTNAYAPPQAMPLMPSYIHTTTMPSKHISTTTKDASVSAMPSLSQPFNARHRITYNNPQQHFFEVFGQHA